MSDVIELRVNGAVVYYSGGQAAPGPGDVPAITTKPAPSVDLGTGNNPTTPGVPAAPNQVIGASFTITGVPSRTLKAFGEPGNFSKASWAIFDSGGSIVFSGTNVTTNLQLLIEPTMLAQLQPGTYVLGVAQNLNLPKLAFYFNQT